MTVFIGMALLLVIALWIVFKIFTMFMNVKSRNHIDGAMTKLINTLISALGNKDWK